MQISITSKAILHIVMQYSARGKDKVEFGKERNTKGVLSWIESIYENISYRQALVLASVNLDASTNLVILILPRFLVLQ